MYSIKNIESEAIEQEKFVDEVQASVKAICMESNGNDHIKIVSDNGLGTDGTQAGIIITYTNDKKEQINCALTFVEIVKGVLNYNSTDVVGYSVQNLEIKDKIIAIISLKLKNRILSESKEYLL